MNNNFRDKFEDMKSKPNPLENATSTRRAAFIVISVCLCALGLFMAITPGAVMNVMQIILGAALLVGGGIMAVLGFKGRTGSGDSADKAAAVKLFGGGAAALSSLLVFFSDGATAALVGIVLGGLVIIKSIFAATAAVGVSRFGGNRGGIMFAISIITGIIGLFLVFSMGGAGVAQRLRNGGIAITAEGVLDFVYAILMPYTQKIKDVTEN